MPAISFLPFLQTVPLATRLLTILVLAFSIPAYFLQSLANENTPHPGPDGSALPWLVVKPGESFWYPWTLLTAGFVELNIFELLFTLITLPLAARYLERIWGPKELIRFCVITIVGSNIIAFGFSWLVWIVTGSQEALYGLPYHGMSGLQVGFLVAFTQLIPEHQIQIFGRLKIRVKSLPGIYLLISNILVLILGSSPYMLIQFGFFVAWVYLRFFKWSENGEFRGDRSETFAFQFWFPPVVRPYISIVANQVFKLATRVGLVQTWDEPQGYSSLPGPGGARAEAERRRALALKALDARLASSPAPQPTNAQQSTTIPTVQPSLGSGVSGSNPGAGVGVGGGGEVGGKALDDIK